MMDGWTAFVIVVSIASVTFAFYRIHESRHIREMEKLRQKHEEMKSMFDEDGMRVVSVDEFADAIAETEQERDE